MSPRSAPAPAFAQIYRYDDFDEAFVRSRVAEFRSQVGRRLNGGLSEEEFRPLRLMNGLYLQLHA
jgi:sulfite reductase (NADPH) hemoprotein beta-component